MSSADALLARHFAAAVAATRCMETDSAVQPTPHQKFQCYGLYKQALLGPCTATPPSELDSLASWKYQAHHHQGRKSRSACQFEYACLMFAVCTAERKDASALTAVQRAFVDAFAADTARLSALCVSDDGAVQPVAADATARVDGDGAHSLCASLASPTLFQHESWRRGCATTVARVLASLLLRAAVVVRVLVLLACPFKRAGALIGALVDACVEGLFACAFLCAGVLRLWLNATPSTDAATARYQTSNTPL